MDERLMEAVQQCAYLTKKSWKRSSVSSTFLPNRIAAVIQGKVQLPRHDDEHWLLGELPHAEYFLDRKPLDFDGVRGWRRFQREMDLRREGVARHWAPPSIRVERGTQSHQLLGLTEVARPGRVDIHVGEEHSEEYIIRHALP
jgi:hypothetical protein